MFHRCSFLTIKLTLSQSMQPLLAKSTQMLDPNNNNNNNNQDNVYGAVIMT